MLFYKEKNCVFRVKLRGNFLSKKRVESYAGVCIVYILLKR